jgi:hypothetical protein
LLALSDAAERNKEFRIKNGRARSGSDLLLFPHSVFLILYSSAFGREVDKSTEITLREMPELRIGQSGGENPTSARSSLLLPDWNSPVSGASSAGAIFIERR